MGLEAELARVESLMRARGEAALLDGQGWTDEELDELRAAVVPFGLPGGVEAFLRWPGATTLPLFENSRASTRTELLEGREFWIEDMDENPSWLVLSRSQHVFHFVTLTVPGTDAFGGVWQSGNEDTEAYRKFADLGHVVATFGALLEAAVADIPAQELWERGDQAFRTDDLRRRGHPEVWAYREPAAGSVHDKFPSADWPAPWIRGLGFSAEEIRPRGASTTARALLAGEATAGTLAGRIVGLSGGWSPAGDMYVARVDDGSGVVEVVGYAGVTRFSPIMRSTVEIDVERGELERWGVVFVARAVRPLE